MWRRIYLSCPPRGALQHQVSRLFFQLVQIFLQMRDAFLHALCRNQSVQSNNSSPSDPFRAAGLQRNTTPALRTHPERRHQYSQCTFGHLEQTLTRDNRLFKVCRQNFEVVLPEAHRRPSIVLRSRLLFSVNF
eukprot:GHVQ01031502.1.p1 GENE.GHVQ01031502.1~~GHVQ01031502.1.p1  ORF type:complete len:133 (-),score=2.22 GHVQ01031502.1:1066-1464(-)